MPGPAARRRRRVPYWVSFAAVTLLLGGLTTVFVLVVLPQRFVLQAGLREAGISFPARSPFRPVEGVAVAPRPPPRPPEPVPGPGPAEAFWGRVTPLLRTGDYRGALPLFSEYLSAYPGDATAWREYGITLARAGRPGEAEAALARAAALTGDPRARLELARLLRDRGEADRALSIYRELVAERPADLGLRHELARTLAWAARYDEAAAEYRALLGAAPEASAYRLELGRTLYWAGRLEEAGRAVAGVPEEAPEWAEAAELQDRLAELLAAAAAPPVPPAEEDRLTRARRAAAAGDLRRAAELYRELLEERPDDPGLWREWADFLEYRADDLEGARAALLRRERLVPLDAEERLRLARLHAWTGREEEALTALGGVVEVDSDLVEAWILLGDLYRWRGFRPEAARAYRRALGLAPGAARAREGLAEVLAQAARAISARERPGLGPEVWFFRDSDGYRRLDLTGRWAAAHGRGAVVVRSGYRRLEGFGLEGQRGVEEGPFGELEVSRWWREGTLRAAVTGGGERLAAFGVEPTFGATLEAWGPGGPSLEASYRHGPAYPVAITLESVVETVRADQLRVTVQRGLGGGWAVAGSGELASVRGGGTDNWRLGGGASLSHRLSPALRVGVSSQLLGYTDAAPVPDARRLYWDPRAFWSSAATLEVSLPPRDGWTAYGVVRPGVAVVEERDPAAPGTVPQLSTEAGVAYRGDRVSFAGDVFYLRGREGDYNAVGLGFTLSVRP